MHPTFRIGVIATAILTCSTLSFAGMHTDKHGNVGYDTAAECDAAVRNGTAKFYKSFTHKPTLIRTGEASVDVMTLQQLGNEIGMDYSHGACDLGAKRKAGRDGVARALQKKYVPFSPDTTVNVYRDQYGQAVRSMMKQCDNWFSQAFPRPVPVLPVSVSQPTEPMYVQPEPVYQPAPAPQPVAVQQAPVRPSTAGSTSSAAPATGGTVAGVSAPMIAIGAIAAVALAAASDSDSTSTHSASNHGN